MKVLKIDKDCVYKIKIEKLSEFEDSFFADVYVSASKNLIEIIESNNKDKDDEFNNIICFVGERGSGKTSSMISFRNSLQQFNDIKLINENGDLKKNYEKIAQCRFHDLDTIDPSVFNGKDSIIEIVVAEMFKKFKEETKKQDYIKKQELVKNFEIVYKDLRTLNKDKHTIFNENLDNLEVLMDLSSAISLKSDIEKLVNSYLDYMEEDGKPEIKTFLTITIDDLDMNIAAGEKMIEDIRKYLIIPKVAIMMAVKFEQLEEVIKQKNIKDLNILFNYYATISGSIKEEDKPRLFDEELNNKTNKYLEKVVPYNKRIYMPEVYGNDAKIEIDLENFNYKESESIEAFIAEKFYQYLRYVIVTKNHFSMITPSSLRGLVELILLFSTLKEVEPYNSDNDTQNSDNIISNLKTIKEYFGKIIINKISNLDMVNFLRDLLQNEIQNLNKKILLFLNEKLYLLRETFDNEMFIKYVEELHKMKGRVIEESVDLGDVVAWMKFYEDYALSTEKKVFIELLKTVYSIRLISELYIGSEEIVHIIGKDVVGKYFEFTGNKHDQKIELKVKIEDGKIFRDTESKKTNLGKSKLIPKRWREFAKLNKSYYSLLEPQYRTEDRYVLPKFYRVTRNTVKEKSSWTFFYFKPFNIFGVKDVIYKDIDTKSDLSIYKDILYLKNREFRHFVSVNDYILFLNIDFYMFSLNCIDKTLENYRFEGGKSYDPIEIIDAIYNSTEKIISNLCEKIKYLNISSTITNIVESKQFDFKVDEDDSTVSLEDSVEGNDETKVSATIKTSEETEIENKLKRLKRYLRDLQKKYDKSSGEKSNIFSRFEATIRENYIKEIKELNNKISALRPSDLHDSFELLLSIVDKSKEDIDLEKEKARIDEIIEECIDSIDYLLENI